MEHLCLTCGNRPELLTDLAIRGRDSPSLVFRDLAAFCGLLRPRAAWLRPGLTPERSDRDNGEVGKLVGRLRDAWAGVWEYAATKYVVTGLALAGYTGWYPRATEWGDAFTGIAAVATISTVVFAVFTTRIERSDRLTAQGARGTSVQRGRRTTAA